MLSSENPLYCIWSSQTLARMSYMLISKCSNYTVAYGEILISSFFQVWLKELGLFHSKARNMFWLVAYPTWSFIRKPTTLFKISIPYTIYLITFCPKQQKPKTNIWLWQPDIKWLITVCTSQFLWMFRKVYKFVFYLYEFWNNIRIDIIIKHETRFYAILSRNIWINKLLRVRIFDVAEFCCLKFINFPPSFSAFSVFASKHALFKLFKTFI